MGRTLTRLLLLATLAALGGACAPPGPGSNAPKPGALRLKVDGAEHELELDVLDIYLVEDPATYPESYVLAGPNVTLVGRFPQDLHVGYGEKFELLEGKRVPILRETGIDVEASPSFVVLPGQQRLEVSGGTITFDAVDGSTVSGTVAIELPGRAPVEGTFAVEAKTWG